MSFESPKSDPLVSPESQASPALHPDSASRVRWIVLGIVAFASASAYLTRYCISAANTTIQADLGFDENQMGLLMSAFGLGYLLCQVPGGWLGSRFGTRFAFAFLSVCWSLSNAWTALASGFKLLCASRFFLGVFQAGLVPISARIIKDWIPLPVRGRSSSCIGSSMSVGAAFTMWLTGWLLTQQYEWQTVFLAYALVGIVWAIGFAWYFRTFPDDHRGVNQAELDLIRPTPAASQLVSRRLAATKDSPETSVGALPQQMLKSPAMWALCIQSFCRAAGYVFFVTWFFAFLEYVYGIEKSEAGFLNSLPLMAVIAGTLFGGMIIDWLLRVTGSRWISRSGTAVVALTVCGFFTMASAWTASATQLSIVIAIGALFSGIGGPAAWAAIIDVGGRHTAIVMAVTNMAGSLSGVVLPIFLGAWFKDLRETGGNWDEVIYLHAVFYFLGALSWLFVNSNRELS